MKRLALGCYGIGIDLNDDGSGVIMSNLQDFSDGDPGISMAMHAIDSLILAHACAGIDVCSPAYLEGIETAVEACCNHDG